MHPILFYNVSFDLDDRRKDAELSGICSAPVNDLAHRWLAKHLSSICERNAYNSIHFAQDASMRFDAAITDQLIANKSASDVAASNDGN